MVMGLSGHLEGEGHDRDPTSCGNEDRESIGLPGCQYDLVRKLSSTHLQHILI